MWPIHPQETDMNRINPRAKTACAAAVLALVLGACASSTRTADSGPAASPRTATRGHAGCFDPRSARGFTAVSDDTLVVDTGSNHYRVRLDATCFGADFAPAMQFRGDSITGRICGNFGDKVVWTHHECGIQDVEWITPEEHDALLNPPKKEGTPTSG